jgi:hypothetical protein
MGTAAGRMVSAPMNLAQSYVKTDLALLSINLERAKSTNSWHMFMATTFGTHPSLIRLIDYNFPQKAFSNVTLASCHAA